MPQTFKLSQTLEDMVRQMYSGYDPTSNTFGKLRNVVDSWTFELADANGVVVSNKATAIAGTIPPNVDVPYPIGTVLKSHNIGAGDVTVTAGAGVTLRVPTGSTAVIAVQYASWRVTQIALNTWILEGFPLGT